MRHQIAQEGDSTVKPGFFNKVLKNGALTWENSVYPVMKNISYPTGSDVIGRATDIIREEDGVITAEIEWFDEYYATFNFNIAFQAVVLEYDNSDEIVCIYCESSAPWGDSDWAENQRKEQTLANVKKYMDPDLKIFG